MRRITILLSLLLTVSILADDYTIEKYIGPIGPGDYDGAATNAQLYQPEAVARDAMGNLYVADNDKQVVRKIAVSGEVTTVVGPQFLYGGSLVSFARVSGVAVDLHGVVYVADADGGRIWRVSTTGVVSSLVTMTSPRALTVDSVGNVYVAAGDHTVSRISPGGSRQVLAGLQDQPGTGDGTGAGARFQGLTSIALDAHGDLFVVDGGASGGVIRRITISSRVVTTLTAPILHLYGIAASNDGTLYASKQILPTIVKLVNGVILPFVGSGLVLRRDGVGANAAFGVPKQMTMGADGNLYVADSLGAIRRVTPSAEVTTVAGSQPFAVVDGERAGARLMAGQAIAFDADGNAFVADNRIIRKITTAGVVSTIAGNAEEAGSVDGNGANARFNFVRAIVVGLDDALYVLDLNAVRRIAPNGDVTTLAGQQASTGSSDGDGTDARFATPSGLAMTGDGTLYIADTGNFTIRRLSADLEVTTLAGTAGAFGSVDDTGTAARFAGPRGLAVDSNGDLLVVDTKTIRRVTLPETVVTTLAGDPSYVGTDPVDGTGNAARISFGSGIALQSDGTAVFADSNKLRTMSPAAVVSTVAGGPDRASVEGTGANARFASFTSSGIGVDADDDVYVCDPTAWTLSIARPAGIADVAVATPSSPAVGAAVQLDTDIATATSWSWRIVRRPSHSAAQLSATNVRNPTFVPDVPELFTFLLRAEGPAGVRYSLVDVRATATCDAIASAVATVNDGYETTVCPPNGGGVASVAVSGGGTLAYQWNWSETPGGALHPIDGATAQTYAIVASDFEGYGAKYLSVVVTPSCGAPVSSNPLTVTIYGAAISAPGEVFANATYTATVDDPSDATSYAWAITNGSIVSGANTRTVTFHSGSSGSVTLVATAVKDGCSREVERVIPIVERAENATLLYMVTPCRIVDSRSSGGLLPHLATRTVDVGGRCGVPVGAKAAAVNLVAVAPTATGFLSLYPGNGVWPGTSMLSYRANKTRATAGIVALAPDGTVKVYNNGSGIHFIIDVTGYFQ
ncbi:MAG TPA: hypothetical protein VHW00_00255 [Thermoanaerobaculia bacterium]|nr:hypothetical protein [Thermoanaerobaculia bacterium]